MVESDLKQPYRIRRIIEAHLKADIGLHGDQ